PEINDIAHFLVDDVLRQPEFRDLAADHAAGAAVRIEHHAMIAERGEVTGDGQRRGSGANQRNALAVRPLSGLWQAVLDVALIIRRHALQAANCHRLFLDTPAPTRRLTGAVAGAAENSRKDVRLPVDHVRVSITLSCNKPDVFRYRRVRRASPLAIHDLVEILRVPDIGRLQTCLPSPTRG